MATHPSTPYQTTLSAALDASAVTIKTAASTGFAAGKHIVIGKEAMLLVEVDLTNHTHQVKRGMKGTAAQKHASGAIVSLGANTAFGPNSNDGVEVAGYVGDLNIKMKLPIGNRAVDPDTGYEYVLCDSAAAFVKGEWVVFTGAGAASQLAATSKGWVGIVAEAVGASDKLFWVLVKGICDFAMTSSDVTTAALLQSAAGYVDIPSSAAGAYVRRAACTVAPSTATSPALGGGIATVYLDNPWTDPGDAFVS